MEQLAFQQREAANVAALKIQTFIHDIETAMKAATKYQNTAREEIPTEYEFELKKLFYLAPAITEAAVFVSMASRWHISLAPEPLLLTPKEIFPGLPPSNKRCMDNLILGRCTLSANQNLT